MAGKDNLIPLSERSEEEARKIQSKGGKASAIARRERATVKRTMEMFLSQGVSDKRMLNRLKRMGFGLDEDGNEIDITNVAIIPMQIMVGVINGNPKMVEIALKLLGESGEDKIELTGSLELSEKVRMIQEFLKGEDD